MTSKCLVLPNTWAHFEIPSIHRRIRGALGSSTMMVRAVGLLIGYVIGVTVPYLYVPVVSVLFPIIFFVIFVLLPNTPQFYLRKHQTHVRDNIDRVVNCNKKWANISREQKKHCISIKAIKMGIVTKKPMPFTKSLKGKKQLHVNEKRNQRFNSQTFVKFNQNNSFGIFAAETFDIILL